MAEDEGRSITGLQPAPPANDNGDTPAPLDARILLIARALGRQIARERFKALKPANDNQAPSDE